MRGTRFGFGNPFAEASRFELSNYLVAGIVPPIGFFVKGDLCGKYLPALNKRSSSQKLVVNVSRSSAANSP